MTKTRLMKNGALSDVAEIGGRGRKRDRLRLAEGEAGDDEEQDQRHLEQRRDVLEDGRLLDAGELHQR